MSVRIIAGDCRETLKTLPDCSVQMVCTSPPYYSLRDYGTASWDGGDAACDHQGPPKRTQAGFNERYFGRESVEDKQGELREHYRETCGKCGARRIDRQIGLESSVEAYVAELVGVFREVRRVLRDDGCVFLNLGDSYQSNPKKGGSGTFNGRNGRGEGYARALRGGDYDTPDIALADSPARDCLCGSLCDACRVAYQTGIAHSDGRPAPTPAPSPSATIPASTVSASDHLPTSGSVDRADRTSTATLDSERFAGHAAEPLPASPVSTIAESSQQPVDCSRPLGTPSACLLCSRSISAESQASAHTTACTCGIGTPLEPSYLSTLGRVSSGLAYPHSTTKSRTTTPILKEKDLIGVPWRVAFALQADGWYLRSDVIWAKPNPMPESVRDRPTKAHEYIFLLTKSPRYFWDAEAVKEEAQYGYSPTVMRSDGDGWEHTERESKTVTPGTGGTRNIRSVWNIATAPFKNSHFATFPPALAERCIKAGTSEKGACPACGSPWKRKTGRECRECREYVPLQAKSCPSCSHVNDWKAGRSVSADMLATDWSTPGKGTPRLPGGFSNNTNDYGWQPTCACPPHDPVPCCVLDPFAGAGTVGLVADRLGRDAVLLELNPEYCQMIRRRITNDAPLFAEVS
jgi:DNA modification methylase